MHSPEEVTISQIEVEVKKKDRKLVVAISWAFWGSTILFCILAMVGLDLGRLAILSLISALVTECVSQYMKGWIVGYERAARR